jgi:HPt (histidine-containing phosphotransfer) domain-containing protein
MAALREAFVAGLPSRLDGLRAALAAGDRVTVQREAHRLAGTGVSYGLPQLTAWGRAVEQLCRAEPAAGDGELAGAVEELARLVASLGPACTAAV